MHDVLLVIQRTSDGYVLCSDETFEDEPSSEVRWFAIDFIPDTYGYITVLECQLMRMGYTTAKQQHSLLPKIVADCIGEHYDVQELRFLRLPEEQTNELPMILQ